MNPPTDMIITALLEPRTVSALSQAEWDLLIRQGRRTNLLARLAHQLTQFELIASVPLAPRNHLKSALRMAQRQQVALRWEVTCISKAFAGGEARPILLKGAAYVMAGLDVAHGRTFSDVDILVPKGLLGHCEAQLMLHGWQASNHDAYDQRYYRRWMHEIPPLRHVRRGTTLDLHHSILPQTARTSVNTRALLDGAHEVPGIPGVYVLQDTDMVIHSATHLFHEGDFEKGLRDLFDLDSLLRQFGAVSGFWQQLVPRASTLGLTRPLYYALRYTTSMLGTPVPADILALAEIGRPAAPLTRLMDACYLRALRPAHASSTPPGTGLVRLLLYLRSHWIKMPFHLLAYHLGRKLLVRARTPTPTQTAA